MINATITVRHSLSTPTFFYGARLWSLLFTFLCLLFVCTYAIAQEDEKSYLYVNTDNLILRDRPEKYYKVFAILHAPCKVELQPTDEAYQKDKSAMKRFYQVRLKYKDSEGRLYKITGYVEKQYMVADETKITAIVKETDKNLEINASVVDLIPYFGPEDNSPNPDNAKNFRWPKYKGGEKTIVSRPGSGPVRKYLLGPKGGCYYINAQGNKTYVDKKHCKGAR